MVKYKTAVTDYEGLQGCLDTHAAQGWRLFSVSPDTWRKSLPSADGDEAAPFNTLTSGGKATEEYSASYYLLVFQKDEFADVLERAASAEEDLPLSERSPFEE